MPSNLADVITALEQEVRTLFFLPPSVTIKADLTWTAKTDVETESTLIHKRERARYEDRRQQLKRRAA